RGRLGATPAAEGKSSPWSSIPDRILDSEPRMPRMASCWYCGSDVPPGAQYCNVCGHSQSDKTSSPLFGVVDPITGIWNQKFVEALIGQEANRAVRYHRPLSVLVVELDHAEHIHNELEQNQVNTLMGELAE